LDWTSLSSRPNRGGRPVAGPCLTIEPVFRKYLIVVSVSLLGAAVLGCGGSGGGGGSSDPSAKCVDGSLSYSAHCSGTCSHHCGVSVWYNGCGS